MATCPCISELMLASRLPLHHFQVHALPTSSPTLHFPQLLILAPGCSYSSLSSLYLLLLFILSCYVLCFTSCYLTISPTLFCSPASLALAMSSLLTMLNLLSLCSGLFRMSLAVFFLHNYNKNLDHITGQSCQQFLHRAPAPFLPGLVSTFISLCDPSPTLFFLFNHF